MDSIPQTSGIYKITCLPTGKIYIGGSCNCLFRWREHRSRLNNGKHHNKHLQNAWACYGASAFSFVVIEEVARDRLNEREQYYLDALRPYDHTIGFNISIQAEAPMRGRKASAETRAKQSAARMGHTVSQKERQRRSQQMKASPPVWLHTQEVTDKSAESRRGLVPTEAQRRKIADAHRGRKRSDETRQKLRLVARSRSLETRQKMSDAAKRRPPPSAATRQKAAEVIHDRPKTPRHIITTPQGEELLVFLPAFCLEHGLSYSTLKAYAHKYPKAFKGYTVRLVPPRTRK